MKYKVGDKVRCVDYCTGISIGQEYTIVSVCPEEYWYRVVNDVNAVDGYTSDNFELVQEGAVLAPEEVFKHLRKGTQLQYRRTSSTAWLGISAGVSINDNPSYKMITQGEWRIKPEPEVIELNGKKYREITD